MYLDAVEYGIADTIMNNKTIPNGTHTIMENGNICIGTYSNKKCTGEIVEVEVNGQLPKEGSTITITDGKIEGISLLYGDKIVVKNNEGNLEYSICALVSGEAKTKGARYTCEVKEGTSYTFYVLSNNEDGTTNLIMDRNICEDGTPAEAGKTCSVDYDEDASGVGPVTAMTYLNNATSSWKNIDDLNLTYDDEGGNFTGFAINGKARLPYKSEISDYDSTNKTNAYLYDYLASYNSIQTNTISGVGGYWTLSSAYAGGGTWHVYYDGFLSTLVFANAGNDFGIGVRPVITIKL